MKHLIFALLALVTVSTMQAQNENCDGIRFIDDVFADVTVTPGIKYGEGERINGTFQELFLDVYEPAGDDAENRPVVIWAFGGSFIAGEREDVAFLCEAFAKKGYVAVTIDYRLYDGPLLPLPTAVQMQEVVVKAVGDMKGAIRYLRDDAANANQYRIDPEMIIVGGISAGSIVACHTAVLDDSDPFSADLQAIVNAEGGIEGSTNDLEYSTEVQGYINFSGGLASAQYMDEGDPRFYSIHDDMDAIVPYGAGFARVFGQDIIFMEGSKRLSERADSLGIDNTLWTIDNSIGHVSYFLNSDASELAINNSANFAAGIVCEGPNAVNEAVIADIHIYPNPTTGILNFGGAESTMYTTEVRNLMGSVVHRSHVNNRSIDLSHLSAGQYVLTTTDLSTGEISAQMLSIAR